MGKVIVDVREPEEYVASHVAGALNILLSQIQSGQADLADLSKDDKVVVYCNSGNRSALAKALLERQGFKNITNGINQANVEANRS